ncbi:MAG TPA: ABC transporter permease [Pyrinomonadaceae bacterium]|nr:ABC transporter permease [Pyrinomonadaceae bacterium]
MNKFWQRRNRDGELEAEIRGHIDQAIQDRIDRGESLSEARSKVLSEFGNVLLVKEVTRSMWRWSSLERLVHDLRFGLRTLKKSPGFCAVVILTIAFGIAATTTIFSVVYGVVLRPLPFQDPERLVAIWTQTPQVDRLAMAAANYRDIKEQSTVFEDVAILRATANYNLTGDGDPEWLQGAGIPSNLFSLLRVEPALGRGFTTAENQPGNDHVVILSHALWQRRYGSDVNIVGRTIRLENVPFTVVGVMDPTFRYPTRETQLWTPLTVNPADSQTRTGFGHATIARLKPGATVAQAQNELNIIATRLAQQYPAVNTNVRFNIYPLRDDVAGPATKPLLTLLAASIGLVLIGCCNLANLLLTRTLSRNREIAVRTALGASRNQLLLHTAAELLPLLSIGAVLGLLAAQAGIRLLLPLLPASLPRVDEIGLNLPVLLFSVALLLFTGAVVVVISMGSMKRFDLAATLREDTRTSTHGRTRLRNLLVISQVAMTVILLTGAGLLIRTFVALKEVDPGFRTQGVLSVRLAIPRNKYKSDQKVAAFCREILQKVRALPQVEVAGMGNRLPLSGPSGLSTIEFERPGEAPGALSATDDTTITPDYLRAMDIPLLRGRYFTDSDTADSPLVVILDEQVAQRAWPGENPIGRRVRSAPSSPWAEVVGVVGHVRHEKLETDERWQIYWNYLQRARDRMSLVVRTSSDPHLLVTPVLSSIKSIDPDQPSFAIRTMSEVVDQSLSLRWFNALVVSLFAASSLLLAMLGIYGVISWNVAQQTREIGVRIALGADRSAVLRMVLGKGLRMTAVGIVIGVLGSLLLMRFVRSLLFGVAQTDPLTFIAVPALLILAAGLACLIPARRALKVDPLIALRYE